MSHLNSLSHSEDDLITVKMFKKFYITFKISDTLCYINRLSSKLRRDKRDSWYKIKKGREFCRRSNNIVILFKWEKEMYFSLIHFFRITSGLDAICQTCSILRNVGLWEKFGDFRKIIWSRFQVMISHIRWKRNQPKSIFC